MPVMSILADSPSTVRAIHIGQIQLKSRRHFGPQNYILASGSRSLFAKFNAHLLFVGVSVLAPTFIGTIAAGFAAGAADRN